MNEASDGQTVSQEKRHWFVEIFPHFVQSYLSTPDGEWHIGAYDECRAQGHRNFQEVVEAADRGEDVTDQVLLKLLPYHDSASNREKGAWHHIAPTITGDLKKWFENVGWTKPQDWPQVAQAILEFLRRCSDDPKQLPTACDEFLALPYSKGFQSGMVTPILNALRPDAFALINSQSQKAINHLAGTKYTTRLADYPQINAVRSRILDELSEVLAQAPVPAERRSDLFDMFCYWSVSINKGDGKDLRILPKEPTDLIESAFSLRTFQLLAELHQQPKYTLYQSHKEEFDKHLEEPFQQLMHQSVALLPEAITERMETEKGIFGQIRKNDYGKGGTWDFYWGALYPKGGKRTEDAQLYLWINWDHLEFGFYIGEYGGEQRRRFRRNCKDNVESLAVILQDALRGTDIKLGPRDALPSNGSKSGPPPSGPGIEEWLRDPGEDGIRAAVYLSKEEVLSTASDELAQRIADAWATVFPFVILATSDDPMPIIGEYDTPSDQLRETNAEYSIAQMAAGTGLEVELLHRWATAVDRKGQAIVYGPPGTGKTYLAQQLATHLVGGGDGFVELVQFHPAYAYEDFMQGIRPVARVDGGLDYPLVPGRFLQFCERAQARRGRCVLIIDEINRANLARVFGELMYLLEYRGEVIPLAGGTTFSIPSNVRIIGTMNTADRSIALVDHALRRRFAFLALYPNYEVLRRYHQQTGFPADGLVQTLVALNVQIGDPHYEVGISFFLRERLAEELEDVWQMEIEPYLEEYFFDQPQKVEHFRWTAIRQKVLP